jgi:hypothetical protein
MTRIENFMTELATLMEKYKVEIDVEESCHGVWGDYVFDHICFCSEPDWEDDSVEEHLYQEFNINYKNITSNDIRETLKE